MDANHSEPFIFYTERRLVLLTGRKASNLAELLRHLGEVSGASIFHHTHCLYLTQHFQKPRSYSEFANWVSEALQEQRLAERLAAIDLLAFTTLRELREAIMNVVRNHIEEDGGRNLRECPAGDEFHFCEAKSFIFRTGVVASDTADLFAQVSRITNPSLYFHFLEARLRLERPTNDFSAWLRYREEDRLAKAIERLDPYKLTLDELRSQIVRLGRKRRSA